MKEKIFAKMTKRTIIISILLGASSAIVLDQAVQAASWWKPITDLAFPQPQHQHSEENNTEFQDLPESQAIEIDGKVYDVPSVGSVQLDDGRCSRLVDVNVTQTWQPPDGVCPR